MRKLKLQIPELAALAETSLGVSIFMAVWVAYRDDIRRFCNAAMLYYNLVLTYHMASSIIVIVMVLYYSTTSIKNTWNVLVFAALVFTSGYSGLQGHFL